MKINLTNQQLIYLDYILDDYQQLIDKFHNLSGNCMPEFNTNSDWQDIEDIRSIINNGKR